MFTHQRPLAIGIVLSSVCLLTATACSTGTPTPVDLTVAAGTCYDQLTTTLGVLPPSDTTDVQGITAFAVVVADCMQKFNKESKIYCQVTENNTGMSRQWCSEKTDEGIHDIDLTAYVTSRVPTL
jgi:hypothetical protein